MGLVQLVLKGRLRGCGVGLVQLMRDWPNRHFPCPDVFARHLLDLVLEDFRETGHHYLMCLVTQQELAWQDGDVEKVTALDRQIYDCAIHKQIPQRWCLDILFSEAGYRMFGEYILPYWSTVLIQLCTLQQYWVDIVLGYKPTNPYMLPGWHADEDVYSTDWLKDFQPGWAEELLAALPHGPEEEAHAYRETGPNVADLGGVTTDPDDPAARWLH